MPIRTLIFDLGKVIVDFSFDAAYSRMHAISGLSQEEIRDRLLRGSLVRDFESGRIGPVPFVAEVNRRMDTAIPMEDFGELWSSIFHPVPLLDNSLFQNLARRHRLVLLSNTNELHFEMIRGTYSAIANFDALVLSYEVGALKPDRAIYDAAVAKAQCAAHECLFFDDLPENVQGALDIGMNARQFTGREKLLADLAEFGIGVE